jgi:hypothetical protein
MAGELQVGSNWFSHAHLDNESLDYSQAWGHLLSDCIAILWEPGLLIQHITFSIINKKGSREYVLKPTQANLSGLDKTVQCCLKSRNLEHFLSFLEYAEVPEKD